MLNDEKVVERQNELFFAQSRGVPEDHELLLSFFDRRKLQIAKSRALPGILRGCSSHGAPYWSAHCNEGLALAATSGLSGSSGLFSLSGYFVQPNKGDKPNKLDKPTFLQADGC